MTPLRTGYRAAVRAVRAVRAVVLELGETGATAVLPAFDTRPKRSDDDE